MRLMRSLLDRLLARMPWLKKLPPRLWALLAVALVGLLALAAPGISPSSQAPGQSAILANQIQPNPVLQNPVLQNPALLAVSVFLKLGAVLGVMVFCLFLLRRWRGSWPGMPVKWVRILDTTRLSPRQALHLVQVGEQVLLIGATDQTLSLLAEIDSLTASETLPASELPASEPQTVPVRPTSAAPGLAFAQLLGLASTPRAPAGPENDLLKP